MLVCTFGVALRRVIDVLAEMMSLSWRKIRRLDW